MSDQSDQAPEEESQDRSNEDQSVGDMIIDDPIEHTDSDFSQQDKSEDDDSDSEEENENVIDTYKGQMKGQKIPKEKHQTPPFLTKYEKARVIGTRALQISKNSPIYVDAKDTTDPIAIAQQELYDKKIPFIVRRYLPNGDYEDWELSELLILD